MPIQLYSAPMKYKDQNGNYQNIIGISGNPGRGIASIVLNNDYTLTINFTDNTSTTTGSIRGNGIASIEKTSTTGVVDTYTITDSDGGTSTFTIENGVTPSLSIGTVVEGQAAAATITGTADAPVLNLVLPAANLANYVQKTDYANTSVAGIVQIQDGGGLTMNSSTHRLYVNAATTNQLKAGTDLYAPVVPSHTYEATFYGLAKAAGDTTQSQSGNAVGTYTDDAKSAIRSMLGAGEPLDVQINGTSIVSNGVANVPVASTNTIGVAKVSSSKGLAMSNDGECYVLTSNATINKSGSNQYRPITPSVQDSSAFYGLAKAAGDSTQSASSNAVGTYTDTAKEKIQHMLGIDTIIAPNETNPVTNAHVAGDLFTLNGKLYQATTTIASGESLVVGTNCAVVDLTEVFPHDVQVNGTSVVDNGMANIPVAGSSTLGVVKVSSAWGLRLSNNEIVVFPASDGDVKAGTNGYKPIASSKLKEAVFYGLSKAAGVDLANETVTFGTYPATSQAAIKSMLGVQDGLEVVRLI